MFEIINTVSENDIEQDFIAIGGYYDNSEKKIYHSVIIIQFRKKVYAFHYTGLDDRPIVFDENIDEDCFHKITTAVPSILVPSFLKQCEKIFERAAPVYGYFYSGEFYDIDGNHNSDTHTGETMTCAGFCLNILKGFLMTEYVDYTQWDSASHEVSGYLEYFSNKHSLDIDLIAQSHRRISPLDLLCSGYFNDLPIQKKQIDSKKQEVFDYLQGFYS